MSEVKRYWHMPGKGFAVLDPSFYEEEQGYVAFEDYDKQAQEIERLKSVEINDLNETVIRYQSQFEELYLARNFLSGLSRAGFNIANGSIDAVLAELEQLKSRQSGVVLPERMAMPFQSMFSGSPAAYAKAFDTAKARNACLDEVAHLNSSAVSAGSTEVDLQSSGLGYPLAKEQAVQLWHQGFRSEPISVLEAWEAIGHDISCNPSKEELLDSLRNMSAICRAAFEVEIPEIAATYDGLYLTPVMPLKAGEHLMTIAQHQRIEKQIRAGIAAPGHSEQVREVQGEAVQIEVVAVTREDGDGELYLDWTLEGGISALEFAGQKLLVAHGEVVGEDGSGVIYTAPSPGKQQGEC